MASVLLSPRTPSSDLSCSLPPDRRAPLYVMGAWAQTHDSSPQFSPDLTLSTFIFTFLVGLVIVHLNCMRGDLSANSWDGFLADDCRYHSSCTGWSASSCPRAQDDELRQFWTDSRHSFDCPLTKGASRALMGGFVCHSWCVGWWICAMVCWWLVDLLVVGGLALVGSTDSYVGFSIKV